MLDFEKKVSDFIARRRLTGDGPTRVYVALSGGADSVALLAVMTALGYECSALHCNFHLRGTESDRDERHAVAVAAELGVAVEVRHCDVSEYRRCNPGVSVEMACRELRYDWFESVLGDNPGAVVAIGHHREDNVETFFLNALRGSGIKGLSGMAPRRGRYIRPLLACSRHEILEYLGARGLGYVTDSSNLSNDYQRNVLRNEIIPLLDRYFAGGARGVERTMECLSGNREVFQAKVDETRAAYVDSDGTVDLAGLMARECSGRQLLFELLNDGEYRFNMSVVDDMLASAGRSGCRFDGGDGHSYLLDRGRLVHSNDETDDCCLAVDIATGVRYPSVIESTVIDVAEFCPVRDAWRAYFDVSVLDGSPRFELRRWRHGDRMKPYGMKGSRKLSDMFTDAKLSADDKKRMWVLTRNGDVIWVPGLRSSRLFSVTGVTSRVLCLHFRGNDTD